MAEPYRGRGEGFYYLSRGQLVLLAAGFTVCSVLIFLLGVFVGQGIEGNKNVKGGAPVTRIPIQPVSPGSGATTGDSAEQEMTFYDTLTEARPGVKGRAAPEDKGGRSKGKTGKLGSRETIPAHRTQTEVSPPKAKEKARAQRKRGRPVWSVQVNAFPHRRDARSLAKRLSRKGYDAYVVSTTIKGKTWYRVQVGQFATRGEAKRLQQTLRKKEKYKKAFIARSG